MNINVPAWARSHFWEEPPAGSEEFWSMKFPPPCKVGETLTFRFDGQIVATAIVSRIERPGLSACEGTGRFRGGFKIFWHPSSFKDLRGSAPRRVESSQPTLFDGP